MAEHYSNDRVIFMSGKPTSASVASSKGFTVDLSSDDVDIVHTSETELSEGSATSGKYSTIN